MHVESSNPQLTEFSSEIEISHDIPILTEEVVTTEGHGNIPISQSTDNTSILGSESMNEQSDESSTTQVIFSNMKDSGISASMVVSADSVVVSTIPLSSTQDSMPLSFSDEELCEAFDNECNAAASSLTKSEGITAVSTHSVSSDLTEQEHLSTFSDSIVFDIKSHSKSDGVSFQTEFSTDEPKLETETKIEVLPDGTVVTRKITKTIRKRVVAKSVLTKSEEGELSVASDNQTSVHVQKFLSLGNPDNDGLSSSESAEDKSPTGSATERFLTLTKGDVDELNQESTEDLPASLDIERTITVVQSQTTCIEGEDAKANEGCP